MEHLLEIKNIQTCFKTDGQMVKAVDGVSMYLEPGEIIGVVGESGSGKSVTMMSMLQLISSPGPAGRFTFRGKNTICWSLAQIVNKCAICGAEK